MVWGAGTAGAAGSRREAAGAAAFRERLAGVLQAEQDRWFLWTPVLFGIGIFAYFRLPGEPHLAAALMPVLMVLALASVLRRGALALVALNAAIAVALGFAAAKVRTDWVAAPVLERQLYRVEVAGFVEIVEPRPTRGQRITLRVTRLGRLAPEERPRRVRVRIMSAMPDLRPGDAIRIKATLAPPSMPALPGDYDFARAAWFSGLGGVGYATARPEIDREAAAAPWALRAAAMTQRLRQAIGARIAAALPGEAGAIATALITGERGGITAATTDAFRDSGLVHILSISGLHMVVMAGSVFFAVRLALAAIPVLALRFPIKKWAAAAAILGALGYLLISGNSFPTIRAWITISIVFGAIILDRPAIAMRNVALAALTVLALVPESLFDAGFQMSFAAVVALVAAYEMIRDRAERRRGERGFMLGPLLGFLLFFGGIVLTTVVASLAVAPFSAFHFHQSQQYAVLANLIAVPICNIVVMPAALATLVAMPLGLEAGPLWVMGQGIEGMLWCAFAVARLPGAVGRIPAFNELAFGLMVAGGLWLCLWRARWRLLGLAGLAAGLAAAPMISRSDILVGDDAQLVAIRGPDGRLTALAGSGSSYELQRWLDYDGDERSAGQATSASPGFRCDAAGCTAKVEGRAIAVTRHPAALADDCRRADVLVIPFPKPRGCNPPGLVVDFHAVRSRGTHAIRLDGGAVDVTTVAQSRGDRPWSGRQERRRRSVRPGYRDGASRLKAFAAPSELADALLRLRPEIEDGTELKPELKEGETDQ
ncbi:MAG: ComEC/Rec2 family competence protein [Hyphomicrobiaceae bacterium]|nr:ComEC/Rec2 family competence protein [Hyphomicrobiaceae bacterium]